jgi:cytochrome b pre-mRNA-processing protein 3
MAFLKNLFGRARSQNDLRTLYAAIIGEGREPHWYREGQVPDTLDGRFDMIAAVLTLVLLRMETLQATDETAWLAEVFVDDMEGQLRQIGVGDVVVGKHVGRMMSALGGRLGAYRSALAGEASLEEALERNLYRGSAPALAAVAHTTAAIRALKVRLDALDLAALRTGQIGGASK